MFSFCIFLMGPLMGGLDVACQLYKRKNRIKHLETLHAYMEAICRMSNF